MSAVPTPTTTRALEALVEPGAVLDVGVGGGATSPSRSPIVAPSLIVGVDGQIDMLEAFAARAATTGAPSRACSGTLARRRRRRPPRADVAVCGHVAYNVPELGAFRWRSTAHARRRVVIELTERHPLSWMNDLWVRFHELERPDGPSADDAEALCDALGFDAHRDDRVDTADQRGAASSDAEDAVALVRRRLCLPARTRRRRSPAPSAPGSMSTTGCGRRARRSRRVITLWWDPAGASDPRGPRW